MNNDENEVKPEPEIMTDARGNKYVIDEDGNEQLVFDF